MNQVATTDLYEAAYYLLNGCKIEEIVGKEANDRVVCSIILTGDKIVQHQLTYLNGDAEANIISLRRMVGQMTAWVNQSRKKFKNQFRAQEEALNREGGRHD
jgi:hypothetical protein